MNFRSWVLIFGLLAGLSTAARAQSPVDPSSSGTVLPLWPENRMPGRGAAQPESRNTPPPGGLLKITFVSQPTLEIFKAPGVAGPAPAMIVCPGGGYGLLAYNREGTEIAQWLNSIGVTGLVLKYRVPNNREGAFQDVQRAMRLARFHAAEWGVAPDKLGIIGFSAGGHLAARLGNNSEKAAYPEIDETDKLGCRPDFVVLVYPAYLADTGQLAPEMILGPATPPTLIVHTEDDLHHIAGSKVYDAALAAAHVPHDFLLYPTGGHGFSMHTDLAAKAWPEDTAKWLEKTGVIPAK